MATDLCLVTAGRRNLLASKLHLDALPQLAMPQLGEGGAT